MHCFLLRRDGILLIYCLLTEWEAPSIDNPAYKGIWKAKQIPNPAYKGEWVHPVIANPAYVHDDALYAYEVTLSFDGCLVPTQLSQVIIITATHVVCLVSCDLFLSFVS